MAVRKYNFKKKFLILFFILQPFTFLAAYEKPDHIKEKVWTLVEPHLLPEDHPIKPLLDNIFSKSRAVLSLEALEEAGFINPKVRYWTHIVVTKHPDIPGYVFKIYLDAQRYFNRRKEYEYWLMRIEGARLIKELIIERGLSERFKTPTKWIYTLPEKPEPPAEFLRKNFILVEEDMDLYDDEDNHNLWQSQEITKEFLTDFYYICEDLGLADCSKPDNASFSKDGKIAFIDTQTFHKWPVRYRSMNKYLSEKMLSFWLKLTNQ